MIKQLEMTGKNKDEAITRALEALGLERDDVSVEVLEMGKTGFLGIGSVPAKVRVTYEEPGEEPVPQAEPEAEKVPEQPKAAEAAKAAEAVKEAEAAKSRKGMEQPKAGKPSEEREEKAKRGQEEAEEAVRQGEDEVEEKVKEFMCGLLERMDVAAEPKVTREGDTYEVVLEGEGLGALIGRRGETLDAIQQLTGYAVNRGRSKRVRIHVDAENYRARREESLCRLAHKVAGKVVRYRRSVTLEAMNAYERHVIHAALQDYRGVTTHSVGVEPNRRVVVSYDSGK